MTRSRSRQKSAIEPQEIGPQQPVRRARPEEGPPIPDPLGDDRHVAPSGELTGGSREREGLLRSGFSEKPDGGVAEHPVHDEDQEDLGPDEFEEEFEEARRSGFEPVVDDEAADALDPVVEGLAKEEGSEQDET